VGHLTFTRGEGPHAVIRVVSDLLVAEDVDEQEVVVLLAGFIVRDGEGDVAEGSGLGHLGRGVSWLFGKGRKVCLWEKEARREVEGRVDEEQLLVREQGLFIRVILINEILTGIATKL
jgi:hypothetical protein